MSGSISGDSACHLLIVSLAMSPSAIDLRQQRDRRLRDKLRRELGAEVLAALADPSVVEVMLNADGELWVERLGSGVAPLGATMTRSQAENLLGTVAALAETEINEESPLLEVELPFDGSRFHGVIAPVSSGPLFAIRKRAVRVHTLDDYVIEGILAPRGRDALRAALGRRENIVICGGTGSGKTTLANALLREAVELAGPRIGLPWPSRGPSVCGPVDRTSLPGRKLPAWNSYPSHGLPPDERRRGEARPFHLRPTDRRSDCRAIDRHLALRPHLLEFMATELASPALGTQRLPSSECPVLDRDARCHLCLPCRGRTLIAT